MNVALCYIHFRFVDKFVLIFLTNFLASVNLRHVRTDILHPLILSDDSCILFKGIGFGIQGTQCLARCMLSVN